MFRKKDVSTFIIAEAGVNHNGSLEMAFQLCDAAQRAGADAIKFQTFKTELVITKNVEMATYQKNNVQKMISQFDLVKPLELSYRDFEAIKDRCNQIGIMFLSTAEEEKSLNFLISLGVPWLKVGSGELTNIPYLRQIGGKKMDVILSTGIGCLGEVETAYNTLLDAGSKSVTLLHCTTEYPCPMEEVNLQAMVTLKNAFKTKVGYSDHTLGNEVAIAAVAMGAQIIEKHFTLDRKLEGPDHQASLEPDELKTMIQSIRNIEKALGDGIKKPTQSELNIKAVVRKSIVAAHPIHKGETYSEANVTVKRSAPGILAEQWDKVIGKQAQRDYDVDDLICDE